MTILYVSVDYPTTELNQLATTDNSSEISAKKLAGFYGYYIAVSLGNVIFFPVYWKYTIQYFNGETTPISTLEYISKFVRSGEIVYLTYSYKYQAGGSITSENDLPQGACYLSQIPIVIYNNLIYLGIYCIEPYVKNTSNIYGNIQVYI